jgi:hypothetical protein
MNTNPHQFKYAYDPNICDTKDWRIMYVFNLDENLPKEPWNDYSFDREKWTVCYVSESILYDKMNYSIVKPDMVALYLDNSNKLYHHALYILEKNMLSISRSDIIVFDFIQNMSWAIFFAISAIECFCNMIPLQLDKDVKKNTIILHQKHKITWEEKQITKKQFEYRSIEDKVKVFLPLIFNKKVSNNHWNSFIKLKKLRDSLTHLTSEDIFTWIAPASEKNIRRNIFTQSKQNPAVVIKDLISDLYWEKNKPRWLRLCNF